MHLAEHYGCAGGLAVATTLLRWSPGSNGNGHWVAYGSGQILFWNLLFHSAELRGTLYLCDIFSPVEFSSNWSTDSKVIPPMLTQTARSVVSTAETLLLFEGNLKHSYSISTEEAVIYLINIVHHCFLPAWELCSFNQKATSLAV